MLWKTWKELFWKWFFIESLFKSCNLCETYTILFYEKCKSYLHFTKHYPDNHCGRRPNKSHILVLHLNPITTIFLNIKMVEGSKVFMEVARLLSGNLSHSLEYYDDFITISIISSRQNAQQKHYWKIASKPLTTFNSRNNNFYNGYLVIFSNLEIGLRSTHLMTTVII